MKKKKSRYSGRKSDPLIIKETAETLSEWVVNVRTAKDQLSKLLDHAAQGNEVTITSDGKPKARIVPATSRRRGFQTDWKLLRKQAQKNGTASESIIREERDSRY